MAVIEVSEPAGPPPYVSTPNSPKPRRHEEYYLEDGNLVIQIYEVLFKIWDGSFRRHSQFFEKTAPALIDVEKIKDGSDDDHPLILEGVQGIDFERLLWIIYPPVIGEYKAKTATEWISILDLSTLWKFKDICELAVKELGKFDLDPVEKIELMLKYKIKRQWAYTSFIALCSRPHALDVIEGRQLGIEMTVNIAFAREKLVKWGKKKPEEVKKVVIEVFEISEVSPTS